MNQPTELDVSFAEHLIRTHCPIDWPQGQRCLNCHNKFLATGFRDWARQVLAAAGWPGDEILKLDARTGPWS